MLESTQIVDPASLTTIGSIAVAAITTIGGGYFAYLNNKLSAEMKFKEAQYQSELELRIAEATKEATPNRDVPQNVDEIKTQYHSLFSQMGIWEMYFDTTFSLENKGKEALVKDAMRAKFGIWKANLLELAKEVDLCVDGCEHAGYCNKLLNLNLKYFTKSINEYNNYYLNSSYSPDEKECLDLYMKKFAAWHGERVKSVEAAIQRACNSEFYKHHCRITQAIIFDVYQGAFGETMNDAVETIGAINGDLKGKVFRSYTL